MRECTSEEGSDEEWVPETTSSTKRHRVKSSSSEEDTPTPTPKRARLPGRVFSWKRKAGSRDGISWRGREGSSDGISCREKEGISDGISCREKEGISDGISYREKEGISDGISCREREGISDGISYRGRGIIWRETEGSSDGISSQPGKSADPAEKRWYGIDTPDITPRQPIFKPRNAPGPTLIRTASYTPLELFNLFFTNSMLNTIIENTNIKGSTCSTANHPWFDITLQDMFSFMAMLIYMGLLKCSRLTDYWRGGNLYSLPFPKEVMSGRKFLMITHALHLSSPAMDEANDKKKGTAAYDRLGRIKPLYNEMRESCRRNFHPDQDISIDERMLSSKARTGLKKYMKNKPVKWGYKLFVLADSKNGYTWDFFVYEGRTHGNSGMGLSYESVMELVNTRLLGTGYKLYVDHFYTSPALFKDLLQKKIWACGTIHSNRIGFPKTKENSLNSKSPRGTIYWLRQDSLVFVQWRDTRDVHMCSALHTAHSEDTVIRRTKGRDGQWTVKHVSVPPSVKDYNRSMGGVDLSDALIGYYTVLHKTQRWYKTFFFHFMDIAIVNAFLLHKAIDIGKGNKPLSQRAFRETLAQQLAKVGSSSTARPVPPPSTSSPEAHHKPVYISGDSTSGRLKCKHCHAKTPLKCSSCNVALCLVSGRDCYNAWHSANNL
ncbi:piggyBac transposable element-derived protein 4-like [Cottoperca gobio]|uniref:PiggyBac transposable element-derived protein 4-like n=1 Tax=Cottoperca gobio TaxID=56716 RepID=A0A6J2QMF7_COTGO|nr:piggyBac transposable element-derived protein 4-like [Cottoperca gobio]